MTLTNTIDACAGKLLRGGSVVLLLAVFVLLSLNVFNRFFPTRTFAR